MTVATWRTAEQIAARIDGVTPDRVEAMARLLGLHASEVHAKVTTAGVTYSHDAAMLIERELRSRGHYVWKVVEERPPPDGVLVDTVILDASGERNRANLRRHGRLWWLEDGSMYVYYTPTHWRDLGPSCVT